MVSAFIFGGIPKKAVIKAFLETDIYLSQKLLNEYRDVPVELEAEGKIDGLQLKGLIAGIAAFVAHAIVVKPIKTLLICRDAEDNMMLECCKAADADILITGDKDLLDIEKLPFKLKILSPREFIELG